MNEIWRQPRCWAPVFTPWDLNGGCWGSQRARVPVATFSPCQLPEGKHCAALAGGRRSHLEKLIRTSFYNFNMPHPGN
jgi:hypothetical protein